MAVSPRTRGPGNVNGFLSSVLKKRRLITSHLVISICMSGKRRVATYDVTAIICMSFFTPILLNASYSTAQRPMRFTAIIPPRKKRRESGCHECVSFRPIRIGHITSKYLYFYNFISYIYNLYIIIQ